MNKLSFLFSLFFLISCGDEQTVLPIEDKSVPEEKKPFDQRVRGEVMSALQIPENEKFILEVHKAQINMDGIEDAIVSVNRLDYAMNEAAKSNQTAKMAETGFIGKYNFIFYYDGATDQLSVPIPCPSSPGRKLDVSFENILSDKRKDVVLGYRIRNSGWKAYFSCFNASDLLLVFQWKEFDYLGEENAEAIYHSLELNAETGAKDIVLYSSVLENNSFDIKDPYAFIPVIKQKKNVIHRFFFDANQAKFAIKNNGNVKPANGVKDGKIYAK